MIKASAGYTASNKGTYTGSETFFTIGDISLFNNYNNGQKQSFPFWIPEGTYTVKLFCGNILYARPIAGTMSVIEFNVRK